ncbi:Hpt domain-containing protein [Rheinheimera sp.]|uniref:Hpt domain-containing protein n=1 Tax=Rheinheimera sp. TaxID=1869214 RepID=UPI00307EEB01
MPLKLLITDLTQENSCSEVEAKLQSAGYKTTLATSLTQGVELALVSHFDAMLCLADGPQPSLNENLHLIRQAGYDIPLAILCWEPCHVPAATQHYMAPWNWAEIHAWLGSLTRIKLQKMSVPDDLQQLFLKSLTQAGIELEVALVADDWLTIKHIVHRLKGNAACFGEGEVTALANELQLLWEEQKIQPQAEQLGPLLAALKSRGTL